MGSSGVWPHLKRSSHGDTSSFDHWRRLRVAGSCHVFLARPVASSANSDVRAHAGEGREAEPQASRQQSWLASDHTRGLLATCPRPAGARWWPSTPRVWRTTGQIVSGMRTQPGDESGWSLPLELSFARERTVPLRSPVSCWTCKSPRRRPQRMLMERVWGVIKSVLMIFLPVG